jgi:hypothetical protein
MTLSKQKGPTKTEKKIQSYRNKWRKEESNITTTDETKTKS